MSIVCPVDLLNAVALMIAYIKSVVCRPEDIIAQSRVDLVLSHNHQRHFAELLQVVRDDCGSSMALCAWFAALADVVHLRDVPLFAHWVVVSLVRPVAHALEQVVDRALRDELQVVASNAARAGSNAASCDLADSLHEVVPLHVDMQCLSR